MRKRHVLRGTGIAALACLLAAVATPETRADFSLAFTTSNSHFGSGTDTTFTQVDATGATLTVIFTPSSVATTIADGGTVSLGSFEVSTTGPFGFSGQFSESFTLQIDQTSPVGGASSVSALLEGALTFSSGTLVVNFQNANNTTIAVPSSPPNVTYALQGLENGVFLNLNPSGTIPTDSAIVTPLNAIVTSQGLAVIPEPSSIAFVLTGLGTAGLMRLRRRKPAKAPA